MNWFKKKWLETYGLSDEQKDTIVQLWNDKRYHDSIVDHGAFMYAEGWKDFLVPFVSAGVVVGFLIGRKTR